MNLKKKLGQMLLDAGVIKEAELEQALAEQKRLGLKLGQILTDKKLVTETRLIDIIARQINVEKYCSDRHHIDPVLADLLVVSLSQKYRMAPLHRKGKLLLVAMIDPLDIAAIDAAEDATNCEVEPVICSEHELNSLTSSLYGQYLNLDGVLESVDDSEISVETANEADVVEEVGLATLQDMAEDAPVIRLVNSILFQAVKERVSDIHIMPEKELVMIQFRMDGKLHNVPSPSKSMFLPIVYRIKILAEMDITTSLIPQDGRFTIKIENREINVRVSTMPTVYGENIVMRLLDSSADIYTLEALGMSRFDMEKIRTMINKPYGMILSTGPTGSGKSTSLYSILREIYRPEKNIITLEDPVEYRVNHVRQAQLNRRAGMTFASGLRSILRQDPDVIMVGEIRDGETAGVAIQAAMTGHLVLSTVHTNNAAGAITRLINMGIEPFLVSSVLLVSFAQRLIRTVCPHCAEPTELPREVIARWGLDQFEHFSPRQANGCVQCRGTGYKGRTGIFETLTISEEIQEMVLNNRSAGEITRTAEADGSLRQLKTDAMRKVAAGLTTIDEAIAAVMI